MTTTQPAGRVVVVGATGNLGTAMLRRLASSSAAVLGVARHLPDRTREPYGAAAWETCDVGDPEALPTLARVMEGADAVVHLSWLLQPSHDERVLSRTNVAGTGHVLEAAARAGVPHVVCVSSVGAYAPGPSDGRAVDERWPTTGVDPSSYSRHKAAQERLLDRFEEDHPATVVTRVRPGLVFQREAGSEIARYFLGPLVPRRLATLRIPVSPLPRDLAFQAVHADDVADAVARVLVRRTGGGLNVAADPVLTAPGLARALGGRYVPVPHRLLRALVSVTWRTRLQPTEPGWLDLAAAVPVMDTTRARDELGWTPSTSSVAALEELRDGMAARYGAASHPMRPAGATPRSRRSSV